MAAHAVYLREPMTEAAQSDLRDQKVLLIPMPLDRAAGVLPCTSPAVVFPLLLAIISLPFQIRKIP